MPIKASDRPTGTASLCYSYVSPPPAKHVCLYLRNWESYLSPLSADHMSTVALFVSLLPLSRELGDFESAMESFQKALMLNQNHIQSLQLRGMMLYHHGSLQEAIGNFKVSTVELNSLVVCHFFLISQITFQQQLVTQNNCSIQFINYSPV